MKEHIELGNIGESLAESYLKNKNYEIIARNFKNKIGEIDIIAKQQETIIFVEVKTSSSLKFGSPRERITYHKINKIRQVAISYLKLKGLYYKVSVRFDCLEILGNAQDHKIEHYENIF